MRQELGMPAQDFHRGLEALANADPPFLEVMSGGRRGRGDGPRRGRRCDFGQDRSGVEAPSAPRIGGEMFRYRLHSLDGDDLGESTYAVMIKPGEEIIADKNQRFRVLDVVPFD